MSDSAKMFTNSCMTMLSAALGGTAALIIFSLISVAMILLCCVLGFVLFQDTMDEIEHDLEEERRELPRYVTPLFETPEPGRW